MGNGTKVTRNRIADRVNKADELLDEVRAMMEHGDMPAPAPHGEGLPAYGEGGVNRLIMSMVLGGHPADDIVAELRKRFPQSAAGRDKGRVYWHRSRLRKLGLIPDND